MTCLLTLLSQVCQLLKIAWREKPEGKKKEKNEKKKNYFAVLFAFASVKLFCISCNFNKKWHARKKEVMPTFSLMRQILHAGGMFPHWSGRVYMLGVRAWEIVSMRETHAQCVRVDSPDYCEAHLPRSKSSQGQFLMGTLALWGHFVPKDTVPNG